MNLFTPPRLNQFSRQRFPKQNWEKLDLEYNLVLGMFHHPGPKSLIRLGDNEVLILKSGKPEFIASQLAIAGKHADCLGLPADDRLEHYKTGKPNHWVDGWRASIIESLRKNYSVEVDKSVHINTHLHRLLPELMGQLATGKRVLWITSGVGTIMDNLKDPAFRDYYGFHDIVDNYSIETVPTRTKNSNDPFPAGDPEQVYADIRQKTAAIENFDLAFVGVGVVGKIICHHIKTELGKTAIDVGSMMSVLQGLRNRNDYVHGGMREYLVWDPARPETRI